jgi:hypothetical protein
MTQRPYGQEFIGARVEAARIEGAILKVASMGAVPTPFAMSADSTPITFVRQ